MHIAALIARQLDSSAVRDASNSVVDVDAPDLTVKHSLHAYHRMAGK